MVEVFHPTGILKGEVFLPSSKSISNRLLILKAFHPEIKIGNLSDADDTRVLVKALEKKFGEINVNHAGSTLRFLTAYFAFCEGAEVVLTGSSRLNKRPIKPLVEALKIAGAKIEYLENEGFAPLKIKGVKSPKSGAIEIDASGSSQFVSALLMVALNFKDGLKIYLKGKVVSRPYIQQTINLLEQIGYRITWEGNQIEIYFQSLKKVDFKVEADWSSATFFLGMAINSKQCKLLLRGLSQNTIQGDALQVNIFEHLGVQVNFTELGMQLLKINSSLNLLREDLTNMPDVAQGLAVAAALKRVEVHLSGLQTLPQKESNRIEDLATELRKLKFDVITTNETLSIKGFAQFQNELNIKTYNDHRMAMAFAIAGLYSKVVFDDESVVSKSFPDYWNQLKKIGFNIL